MSNWEATLQKQLCHAQKIAVLGAGSELCGDDAAGMLVARQLNEMAADKENFLAMEGSTAPENFVGVIRSFAPEVLVIVDAAYIDGEIGDIAIVDPQNIDGMSFSTHMLPFKVLINYIKSEVACEVIVLGIKPGNVEFATEPAAVIKQAADKLAQEIYSYL